MSRALRVLGLLLLTGCPPVWAPLVADALRDDTEVAVVPTEDGSQYISVFTTDRVPPASMRTRWRNESEHACKGEYLVLSESASERRQDGKVRGRMYEGFVRCVSPEAGQDLADDPKRIDPKAAGRAAAGP